MHEVLQRFAIGDIDANHDAVGRLQEMFIALNIITVRFSALVIDFLWVTIITKKVPAADATHRHLRVVPALALSRKQATLTDFWTSAHYDVYAFWLGWPEARTNRSHSKI